MKRSRSDDEIKSLNNEIQDDEEYMEREAIWKATNITAIPTT